MQKINKIILGLAGLYFASNINTNKSSYRTIGQEWTYNYCIEKPLGEKDMGSYTIAVYTIEQQERLNIDEYGNKITNC